MSRRSASQRLACLLACFSVLLFPLAPAITISTYLSVAVPVTVTAPSHVLKIQPSIPPGTYTHTSQYQFPPTTSEAPERDEYGPSPSFLLLRIRCGWSAGLAFWAVFFFRAGRCPVGAIRSKRTSASPIYTTVDCCWGEGEGVVKISVERGPPNAGYSMVRSGEVRFMRFAVAEGEGGSLWKEVRAVIQGWLRSI